MGKISLREVLQSKNLSDTISQVSTLSNSEFIHFAYDIGKNAQGRGNKVSSSFIDMIQKGIKDNKDILNEF